MHASLSHAAIRWLLRIHFSSSAGKSVILAGLNYGVQVKFSHIKSVVLKYSYLVEPGPGLYTH